MTGLRAENHLVERLAIIAAIEHITAFLGDWVLNAKGLDKAACTRPCSICSAGTVPRR